ncbi:MAG: osmotically inducible protein OsmC [Ignavibacteriae bacterium HGW-Ignavibacteriae-1]|jgi:putative redox protein|nr:MAG: osmotically inducible protein OsmC [Ignavibacteriae bacterium HGW-Ignavibacteriae-1]
MVKIHVEYLNDLHCQVTHGPSGQSFLTDAPLDNQGKAEYISPTDLLAASIGSCIATIMGIKARDLGVDLGGLKIDVTKEMVHDPHRRVGKLTLEIQYPRRFDPKTQEILNNVVKICPVTRSLDPKVIFEPIFSFPNEN